MALIRGQQISGSVASASYALTASASDTSNSTILTKILTLNQQGYTISKGTVVRMIGVNNDSDIPRIATASYDNNLYSADTLGIAMDSVSNGAQGYVITEGVLLGIDTTNYTSGQLIYLGASGSITGSAPTAPLQAVRLGQVVRDGNNNGSIYVRIDNNYRLGELHDVLDTTQSTSYGDVLMKSGSAWISSTDLIINDLTYNTSTSGLAYITLQPFLPAPNSVPISHDFATYSSEAYFGIMLDGIIYDVTNNYSGLFRCNIVNTDITISNSHIEFLNSTNNQLNTDIYVSKLLRFNATLTNHTVQIALQNYSTANTYRIRPNYRLIKQCLL
jgi:hypothetical protein